MSNHQVSPFAVSALFRDKLGSTRRSNNVRQVTAFANQHKAALALVLTDENSRGALDIVRALAYENISSAVASPDPHELAATSRYCKAMVRLERYGPDTDAANVRILNTFAETSSTRRVLFYGDDAELMFISRNRDELSQHYCFLLPDATLTEQLIDKVKFQRLAEMHRLRVPVTRLVHSFEELQSVAPQLPYPTFVKPALPGAWSFKSPDLARKYKTYKHAIRQFYSASDMINYCRDLPIENGGILVQEFIRGTDREVYSFHGYFDEQSNIVDYFVGRKIRTYPMHHGGSAFVETVEEPEVARICIESLGVLGFKGISKVDLKRNPRDGSFQILEVNPRYTLWVSLGAFAGVNLPSIAFHHQRGELFAAHSPYRVGYRWLFMKQDLRAFLSGYWKKGEWTLWQYLTSLRGRKVYQFFDWKDPVPFFNSVGRFWKRNLQRIFGKLATR